jgi:hypothetical protein
MAQNPPVDLYQPLVANRVGPPPVAIRAIVTPHTAGLVEGVPASTTRGEVYVLLSILPPELRRRVELAVQTVTQGQ